VPLRGGHLDGGATLRIRTIRVSAVVQEHAGGVFVALPGSQVKGRDPIRAAAVHRQGPRLKQHAQDLLLSEKRRHVQHAEAGLPLRLGHAGSSAQQRAHDAAVAGFHREAEGRVAGVVHRVGITSALQQGVRQLFGAARLGHPHERVPSEVIDGRDGRPVGEQQARDLLVFPERSAQEGGPAPAVDDVDLCSALQEDLDRALVTAPRGEDERRVPVGAHGIHVRATSQEQQHELVEAFHGGAHERRPSFSVADVHVTAVARQLVLENHRVALDRRGEERGPAEDGGLEEGGRVRVPVVHEEPHRRVMPVALREVQRILPKPVGRCGVRSVVQEELDHIGVAILRGEHERRGQLPVLRIDVGRGRLEEQRIHHGLPAGLRRKHERRGAIVGDGVHPRCEGQQQHD